jgi:hypothetical protein
MRSLIINLAVIVVVLFAVKSFAHNTVTTTVGGTSVVAEAPQTNPCPVNFVPVFSPVNGKTMFCLAVPEKQRVPVVKE